MKITSLVAATAAVLTLGACSGAPVGLDSSTAEPSFELSNTLDATTTTTFLIGIDTAVIVQPTAPSTCTTSPSTTTSPTTSTTQLSASGTYAVAYGSTPLPTCPTAP